MEVSVVVRLNTADLKALAKAPDARLSVIHLVDGDDPERTVPDGIIVCDADMVLGPALEVIRALATALLDARAALDLRTRAQAAVAKYREAFLPPMTEGMLKAIGLPVKPQYGEYLEDGETVEQRLMRAQRDHERLAVLEEQLNTVQDERAASFERLAAAVGGNIGLTPHQPEFDIVLEHRITGLKADSDRLKRWATTGRW